MWIYKFDYLELYKEVIECLLGDENFWDEMVYFLVDEDSGIVMMSYWDGLMLVFIRLVVEYFCSKLFNVLYFVNEVYLIVWCKFCFFFFVEELIFGILILLKFLVMVNLFILMLVFE